MQFFEQIKGSQAVVRQVGGRMECVPDLAFLQMAAASNNEIYSKMLWPSSGSAMKQRKTNFTSREVEALLAAVADRKDTVLFGVAGGIGWARAWHEVAQQVSAVEGIHRSESDVRKKWTYLKWEAKNTSKPGRDPTSRAVLDILTSRDREASQSSNSLLEQLLVPQQQQQGSPSSPSPVPLAPKKVTPAPPPQPPPAPPEVCLRWNSYHSNMQATFPSLLNNEQFVDVTLACEGRSIKCHKVMLSACSSYFEELLSQNPCQHPIVFMRDLKFWEVQALVEFMYSGEVNVAQDKLPSLLAAAEALQIKGLTGPTNSGSSHDEDSLSVPEMDDSPSQAHMQKRVRKRKAPNTPTFLNKPQIIGQGQYTPVGKPPAKVPSVLSQPNIPSTSYTNPSPRHTPPLSHHHQPPIKIKHEQSPHSTSIKMEPLEITDYSMDQGDSDTGQTAEIDTSATSNHNSQLKTESGGSLIQMSKAQDNGLSDDDQTVSSDCSDDRYTAQVQMDPGENNTM